MISLHSHSGSYCRHAKGTLRQVVEEAIKQKFIVYGLSEHMPRSLKEYFYPEESDLTPNDLFKMYSDFVVEANKLKAEFKQEITLLVGLETEYLSQMNSLELVSQLREQHKLDYIVGSVHHVDGLMIDFDRTEFDKAVLLLDEKYPELNSLEKDSKEGCVDALFSIYFDHQYELLVALKPEVVGHFDLCRMYKDKVKLGDKLWNKIIRNIDYINSYGGLVELNSRGWKKGLNQPYPLRDITKLMISKGTKFTLSDDSHGPDDVGMAYDKLFEYLKEMGIGQVYYPFNGKHIQVNPHIPT